MNVDMPRLSLHLLLAGMFLVALLRPLQRTLEASSVIPGGFQTDLLLSEPTQRPMLDRIAQLDRILVANYTVGPNEDIWSICNRYKIDQFTIRSSNDLEGPVAPGATLHIPNHKGTLYQVQKPENLQSISR